MLVAVVRASRTATSIHIAIGERFGGMRSRIVAGSDQDAENLVVGFVNEVVRIGDTVRLVEAHRAPRWWWRP
jgi:hypothetical protein